MGGKKIKPDTKMTEIEVELIRQTLDEMGMNTPNYGAPLSKKYRKKKRGKSS